jgi:hypothetical protein
MEAWIVVVRHGACPRYPVQNPTLLYHRGAERIPANQSMQTQKTGATILSVIGNGFFRLGHHGGAKGVKDADAASSRRRRESEQTSPSRAPLVAG